MKNKRICFNSIMSVFATISMTLFVIFIMYIFGSRVSSAIYEKILNGINIVICAITNIVFVVATIFIIEVIIVWTSSMSMSLEKMSLGKVVAESKLGKFGVIMTAILGALAIGIAVLCATEEYVHDEIDVNEEYETSEKYGINEEYKTNDEYVISSELDEEVHE